MFFSKIVNFKASFLICRAIEHQTPFISNQSEKIRPFPHLEQTFLCISMVSRVADWADRCPQASFESEV